VFGLALAAVAVMLLTASQFNGGTAEAASVTPTVVSQTANQTCTDFEPDGADWTELKVDPPGNGVFSDGTLTVTISAFNGKSFNWSSNIGVDAVFVKAGAGGSHLYVYNPESTGDTALSSPGDAGNAISHISFCYDIDSTPTPTSTSTNTATPTNTSTPVTSTNTPTTATNTPRSGGGGGGSQSTATRTPTPVSTVAGATIVVASPTLPTGVTLPETGRERSGADADASVALLGAALLAAGLAAAGDGLRRARR
jgi:hypothetical protein